jgi:hypothetical protein
MSINGQSISVHCWLMLEPIGRMTKTLNRTMYAGETIKKLYKMYCICDQTCIYCLVNKGQTSVKSNNVKNFRWRMKSFDIFITFLARTRNCTSSCSGSFFVDVEILRLQFEPEPFRRWLTSPKCPTLSKTFSGELPTCYISGLFAVEDRFKKSKNKIDLF